MNICLLSIMFPPDTGGAERYAYELAQALGRRGHNVDVYIATTSDEQIETHPNVTVTRLFRRRKIPVAETIYYSLYARRAIDFDAYDVVHGTLMPASTIALTPGWRMGDVPLVVTSHGTSLGEFRSHDPDSLREYLLKYALHPANVVLDTVAGHVADRVVAISDHARDELVETYRLDGKVTTIPHGVDTDRFRPHEEQHPAVDPSRLSVLTVGRLGSRKGIGLAIRGLARMDTDAELLIAGTGRRESHLRALAREHGVTDRVRFLGHVPDEELPLLYASADVCSLTSRYEGFGLVLLEAMACGTPVVATDVGGVPSAVQDGKTGFLIPREVHAFAERVDRLTDAEQREQMGTNACLYAEANNWDAIARRVEDVYGECCSQQLVS